MFSGARTAGSNNRTCINGLVLLKIKVKYSPSDNCK